MTWEELLRLPKVELHCHLDGSLSQEFVEKTADQSCTGKWQKRNKRRGRRR